MAPPATIVAAEEAGAFVLRPKGSWVLATAAELDGRLRALKLPQGGKMNESLFRTAAMAGVPVIPCAVAGGEDFGQWTGWLPLGRTRWAVVFGAPLVASEHLGADVRTALVSLYQTAADHVNRGPFLSS